MIQAIALILGLVAAGEATVRTLALPLSGPAIGLMALTTLFCCCSGPDDATGRLFDATCLHLPVLFVPAAVGVVATIDKLALLWPLLVVAVGLGTLATIVVTALTAQALLQSAARRRA